MKYIVAALNGLMVTENVRSTGTARSRGCKGSGRTPRTGSGSPRGCLRSPRRSRFPRPEEEEREAARSGARGARSRCRPARTPRGGARRTGCTPRTGRTSLDARTLEARGVVGERVAVADQERGGVERHQRVHVLHGDIHARGAAPVNEDRRRRRGGGGDPRHGLDHAPVDRDSPDTLRGREGVGHFLHEADEAEAEPGGGNIDIAENDGRERRDRLRGRRGPLGRGGVRGAQVPGALAREHELLQEEPEELKRGTLRLGAARAELAGLDEMPRRHRAEPHERARGGDEGKDVSERPLAERVADEGVPDELPGELPEVL